MRARSRSATGGRTRGVYFATLACCVSLWGCGDDGGKIADAGDDSGASDGMVAADAEPPDTGPLDAAIDGGSSGDAALDAYDAGPPRQEGCEADEDLGSATGEAVAMGTSAGGEDVLYPECAAVRGDSPEVIYRWRAPNAGEWLFDTLGSTFDTALHIRDTECTLLGCADDIDEITLYSRVVVMLEVDQEVFIVVDGEGGRAGDYVLSIHEGSARETECGDGVDNDRDGKVDCQDQADCLGVGSCVETACTDGEDNDEDGATDCQDDDCGDVEPCAESNCADGLDGDNDFAVDCNDSDCDDNEPCAEVICDDNVDGDMNGQTDCEDPACECAINCLPRDPCPEVDLGSAIGPTVASGVTDGCPRRTPIASECAGDLGGLAGTGPERTFLWTAPEAGTFTFDTSGSGYDTTLYLLDGCDGPMLACNEDIATAVLQRSRITRDFAAGESVVIVIDGWGGDSGSYTLHILQAQ